MQTSGMVTGYDICESDSLRGLGIDIIGRVHFDNRDRFSISMGSIGKRPNHVNKQPSGCWHLTFDCFLNLDMWDDTNMKFLLLHVQTAYKYDLGNERWLFGDIIDHVGIYGSRVAEGLSASNFGLVYHIVNRIVGVVSLYVSYRGSAYRYTPSNQIFVSPEIKVRFKVYVCSKLDQYTALVFVISTV